jgi:AraC family transcriptional regulator
MILQEFPELNWLKSQIDQRFQQRRGYHNQPLDTAGFPSVIINTRVHESYRPDITGPISLFLNLAGTSHCFTDGRTVAVNGPNFFISNRFQKYTLEIDSKEPVETFNIHFGEHFSEGVLGALLTPADKILNDGPQQSVHTVAFYNRLYRCDENIFRLARSLQQTQSENYFDKLLFDEQLEQLLVYLLRNHRHILQQVARLPAIKPATKLELFKRLSLATDYMHTCNYQDMDLDQLAATACLSKYHFLRLFRQAYGLSPHQYIQQLRLEKAKLLLIQTSFAVQDIADMLGFENSQSFSRFFFRATGAYPSQYAV